MVKKVFTFRADAYPFECDIVVQNASSAPLEDSLVLSAVGYYSKDKKKRSRFVYEGPIGLINNKFKELKPEKIEEQDLYTGDIGWAGYTQQYFMTVIRPRQAAADSSLKLAWEDEVARSGFVRKMDRIDPGMQGSYAFTVYMGSKSLKIVSSLDGTLKKAINFGFFNVIAKPLLVGMNMIHSIIPNYGVAIILLTIIIKLIFWPLGSKSYRSMSEMKKLQPLMMELREKYKDDKQRMNQEIMGLYKTYKVNPASGCLPLLVQMPIFFGLYRMLYQAIELRHAPFFGWMTDLSAPDRLFSFNFAIPMMDAPYGISHADPADGGKFFNPAENDPDGRRSYAG